MKDLNQEQELTLRLRKLETSQSRYRKAFLATAVLAAVLCTMGAHKNVDDTLQAKSFEVVNDSGKVLARFTSANGKGDFTTYRSDGSPLVRLYSSADDSGRIETYNADGRSVILLSTSSTGSGNISVSNSAGNPSVQLGSSSDKHGGMWIYNADGKIIATMTAASGTADGLAATYNAAGTKTGHLP